MGLGVCLGYGVQTPALIMNRRIRNRTYGGVGGRRE
jgi:hypothetical protein